MLALLDSRNDLVLGQLLAAEAGEVRSLVQELDHRCTALKPHTMHKVMDVIAIQTARGREHDEVILACNEVGRLDGLRVIRGLPGPRE